MAAAVSQSPSSSRAWFSYSNVEKVVKPIAESILVQLGQSFDEVTDAPRQLTLL